MKISKLFHWLYCAVMFLPLFCLPVYALAVRSDNNYQPISIDVYEDKLTEVNQKLKNPFFFEGTSSYISYSGSLSVSDYTLIFDAGNVDYSAMSQINLDIQQGRVYNFRFEAYTSFNDRGVLVGMGDVNSNENQTVINDIDTNSKFFSIYIYTSTLTNPRIFIKTYRTESPFYTPILYINKINLIDVSAIFGIGNEPTLEVFNEYYGDFYFDYGTNNYLIDDYVSQVYNDTDFGSQTIYTLYKEVDDYFNYDDVLSIGDLYEWCNINLFNGSASLGFFIFFHLLEYWLLTSLLWLIFDVLMYVPQLCHRWLDKASLE